MPGPLLTSGRVGLSLMVVVVSVGAQHATAAQPFAQASDALSRRVDVSWRDTSMRDAVQRIAQITGVPVWLDRRSDPSRLVSIEASDVPATELLLRLAEAAGESVGLVDGLVYLGPEGSLARLQHPPPISGASSSMQRALRRRVHLQCDRLASPRELVVELAGEARIGVLDAERIPHDLLERLDLPRRPLRSQLSLLLVGFDLECRVDPDEKRSLQVVPLQPVADPAVLLVADETTKVARTVDADLRFSLRVSEQPLLAVLKQVAKRSRREVVVGPDAIQSADTRVSFEVSEATLEELVQVAAKAGGLQADLSATEIRLVSP